MECQKEKNLESCPCTYAECSKKDLYALFSLICPDVKSGSRPKRRDYFSAEAEKTYDRRIENFINDYSGNSKS